MIRFFRRVREKLIGEGNIRRYFLYAVGEILLVVIGILIALQVNNWNIERTDQIREQKYLVNIVLDLKKDIAVLDAFIAFRKVRFEGDQKLINHINGEPVEDLDELTFLVVNSIMEHVFTPNNTTFTELSNSGNLNLLSSDSLKYLLLELQELYKVNEFSVEHETFDYREYISKSINRNIDLEKFFPVFTGARTAREQNITHESFESLFQVKEYKNGLFITTIMAPDFISNYEEIKDKSERIIALIE